MPKWPKDARKHGGMQGTRGIFRIDWSRTTHPLRRARVHSATPIHRGLVFPGPEAALAKNDEERRGVFAKNVGGAVGPERVPKTEVVEKSRRASERAR